VVLQQLGWMDNAFLLGESPRTPGHFCPVIIYDPATAPGRAVGFEDVVERVRSRLATDPTFRRKVVRVPLGLDQAYWIEYGGFDISQHVRHETLEPPGDWAQFAETVGRVHSRPLNMNLPLWELTYIDGIGKVNGLPEGSFAVMFKIHHAAVDGVSGVRMLTSLHDSEADPGEIVIADPWAPDDEPSSVALIRRAAVHTVTRPVSSARRLTGRAGALGRAAVGTLAPSRIARPKLPERLVRTRFNGKINSERAFDAFRFPIAEMKNIKAKVPGATINDAALAIVAGGLRSYRDERGELPASTLTAAVPVSRRSEEDANSGGNQISMMRAPLHTDIGDPIARLTAIATSTKASKQAQQGSPVRPCKTSPRPCQVLSSAWE
jgi:diacylglycerol O-acyltransferase